MQNLESALHWCCSGLHNGITPPKCFLRPSKNDTKSIPDRLANEI